MSSVTRRTLLTGTTAATATWPLSHGAAAAKALVGPSSFDPALSLLHEWQAAHRRTAALCKKQQNLESQLANTVGFPQAEVYLSDEDVTVPVSRPGDIGELLGDDPAFTGLRARAEADLAVHQACWDAEDKRIGYSAAKRDELAAAEREEELADALTAMPATTLAGIAGKLDAVLREGESREECAEFPWPQIRSALADLIRFGQKKQPGLFMPGRDQQEPYPRTRREGCCFRVEKYAYRARA